MSTRLQLSSVALAVIALTVAGCGTTEPENDPERADTAAMNAVIGQAIAIETCGANNEDAISDDADAAVDDDSQGEVPPRGYEACDTGPLLRDQVRQATESGAIDRASTQVSSSGWTTSAWSDAGTIYTVTREQDEVTLTCDGDGRQCTDGAWTPESPSDAFTAVLEAPAVGGAATTAEQPA